MRVCVRVCVNVVKSVYQDVPIHVWQYEKKCVCMSHLRLSCELEEERSDCGRDTILSELFRWDCRAF